MPIAKYFRLKINPNNKTRIELSAFHLYSGNSRVDQAATISCGFESNSTIIQYLKNEEPVQGQIVTLDTASTRRTNFYITWTFTTETHVDSFRVGSSSSEEFFMGNFSLGCSDNNVSYINFISINTSKKLSYPGPWQLSLLKPVGECFPLILDRHNTQSAGSGRKSFVGEDGRSFIYNNEFPVINNNYTISDSITHSFKEIPGFFSSGKYYFEVNILESFWINSSYNFMQSGQTSYLLLIPDNTERITRPIVRPEQSILIGLNCAKRAQTTNYENLGLDSFQYSNVYVQYFDYSPGYLHGISIDFDNRQIKFVKPKYTQTPTDELLIANSFVTSVNPVGTKYKLMMGTFSTTSFNSCGCLLNVGQKPFTKEVPNGFFPGLGPRWKEELQTIETIKPLHISIENRDLLPLKSIPLYNYSPEINSNTDDIIEPLKSSGGYYIKGKISRVPDIENKKFIVYLVSSYPGALVATSNVGIDGTYEFLNIEYGAYTVTSVDIYSNTVSECIGPIYPTKIEE